MLTNTEIDNYDKDEKHSYNNLDFSKYFDLLKQLSYKCFN